MLFGIIAAAIDLIGRLLIIERVEALKWSHDPRGRPVSHEPHVEEKPAANTVEVTEAETHADASETPPTLLYVLLRLFKSTRAMAVFAIALVYGKVLPLPVFENYDNLTNRIQGSFYFTRACLSTSHAASLELRCRSRWTGVFGRCYSDYLL
jgi:hypothetical protein